MGRRSGQARLRVPAKAASLPDRRRARAPTRNGSRSRRTSRSRRRTPPTRSDFERRHEERFKGVTFDWKDFQRDGQPFPAPNLRARPAAQLVDSARRRRRRQSRSSTPICVRQASRGIRTARCSPTSADPDWRDELKYESPDLWTVTTDGKVTRLTDDGYVYGDVGFSPDGRCISYTRTFGTDMIIQQKLNHGGGRDLFIRPAAGGEPINLTANWDLEPGDTQWSPDGRYLYFTAGDRRRDASVPRRGRTAAPVEQVTKGERRLNGLTIDRAFKTIAYTVGLHEAPPEVYTANIDGTNERKLSDVHGRIVAEIAFSKAERLRWPSYDGTQIEGWLMFPHGYDAAKGPYPLIVTSHGGPHAATGYSFDFKKQFFAANGYFVLRHQLPQLHRLRRRVQVGDVGRVGQEGRRGRRLRRRLRAQALPDRREARRATPATRTAGS